MVKYEQLPHDMSGLTVAKFAGLLDIPVFLDCSCMFSIMPNIPTTSMKSCTNAKMPAENIVMHTGNVSIKYTFGQ